MAEVKIAAASGGGSISIKGPSSSGSDVDLLDTSGNLAISGTSTLTGNVTAAGTLAVTGTSTFSDTLTVTKGAIPEIRIRNSTDSSYANLKLEQTSGSGGYFAITKLGTANGAIGGNNAVQLWQSGNAPIVIGTNGSERMRIKSNGRVLFGTTSEIWTDGRVHIGMDSNEQMGIGIKVHAANNWAIGFVDQSGNNAGEITCTTNSTTYATSSDYRLKENQVSISDGITRLKTLKPYRFNFKADPTKTVDGFFAHEVTAVPEAIVGEKDGTNMQGIDQAKLVPLLTAALQEAIAKIETLETKVAALEAG